MRDAGGGYHEATELEVEEAERAGGCGWWRVSDATRAGLAPPLTEQAQDIESIWNGMLVAAFVVGVLVIGLIVYVVVRFRRRAGPAAAPAP